MSLRRVMVNGVLAVDNDTGVFQGLWAGLGVIFTKSDMSKGWPGVVGNRFPPPGVVIMEDGRARSFFGGGVEGGSMRVLVDGTAGEGLAAR